MVITLAMILSMVPATVSAAEPEIKESIYANQHDAAKHAGDCSVTTGWDNWGDDASEWTSLPESGNYYLTHSVELSAEHKVTGNLNLCLNGFVIKQKANARVMRIDSGAGTLNICDCTAQTVDGVYHAGAITGGNDQTNVGGGAIWVHRGSVLHVYAGRLIKNQSKTAGGAIVATTSNSSYVAAEVYVHGGEISYNKALNGTTYKSGGAIYLNVGCPLKITGGSFISNEGNLGGVIYAGASTVQISNATFTDNQAHGTTSETGLGGVLYGKGTQATLFSGTYTSNDANYGGVVYMYSTASLLDIRDVTMTGNTAATNGGAINAATANCDIEFSGNPQITGNTVSSNANNVRLGNSGVIDVENLSSTAKIGLTLGSTADRVFSTAVAQDYSANFPNDNTAYEAYLNADSKLQMRVPVAPPVSTHIHCECGKHDCTDPNHKQITYYKWDKPGELPDVGDWYLEYPDSTVNVTARKDLETAGTLNLCLNGQTVNGYSGSNACAYRTKTEMAVTINICDHTATGEGAQYSAGKITGFTNTNTDTGAAGIYLRKGGTLNFYGGIIENCISATGGGALYLREATANIYGGLIQENKALSGTTYKNGGVAYINSGTLTVYGGTITNNEANYGGAFHCYGNSTLNLFGGTITGNKAVANGGAINVNTATTQLNFSGNPQITGNTLTDGTVNNLRLGDAVMINVENLENTACVGITPNTKGARVLSTVVASDFSGSFPSDDPDYVTYLNADSKLALKSSFVHEHCICGKHGCTDTTHEKIAYNAWNKTDELPDSGNYCLLQNVTASEQKYVAGELNLCLNGKTVTVSEDAGRAYYVSSNDKLTITDGSDAVELTRAE